MANIHGAAKAALDSFTYQPYSFPPQSAIGVLQGGSNGIQWLNQEFEISYKFVSVSDSLLNCYVRTGADKYQHTAGFGYVVLRTFDKQALKFNDDRSYVYQPTDYCVWEQFPFVYDGSIYIVTYERLRADPNNEATARICVIKSTDGLTGKSFGAPVVQSFNLYSIPSGFALGENGNYYVYFGVATTGLTGLYRARFSPTGELSNYGILLAAQLSENYVINTNDSGGMLCVYRVNSGAQLMQTTSSDYGATWSAGVSTGLGANTGAKVTPSMHKCTNDPNRLIVGFNDRGNGQLDSVSAGTLINNAISSNWRRLSTMSATRSTNGNGELYPISGDKYIYIAQSASPTNQPNLAIYWIITDGFNVAPRPWI